MQVSQIGSGWVVGKLKWDVQLLAETEVMLKVSRAGDSFLLHTHCPHGQIFQDMLEFPAQELRKYFKMGDHVKVIAGRFEGDTGLIVRVEENFVILFSDLTMHEVSAWKNIAASLVQEETLVRSSLGPASPLLLSFHS